MLLAWSISLLFISQMQSVNWAQFFLVNITFLFLLLDAATVPVFVTVIVLFNKYVSVSIISKSRPYHWSFGLNLTTSAVRSIWSIIYFNTIFFSLKFGWLVDYLTNLLFFDIPLLCYYIKYQIINNFLSFFRRYIYFFRYFSIVIICNFFWIIFFVNFFLKLPWFYLKNLSLFDIPLLYC